MSDRVQFDGRALGGVVIDMSERSPLVRRVRVALDETRILIIGAQILLGIQFVGTFQEGFATLAFELRTLHVVALVALVACMGCLIAPSMQHRIVEKGYESMRVLRVTGTMAGIALVLFAVAIGIDNFNIQQRIFGTTVALVATSAFLIFLATLWFVPFWHDRVERRHIMHSDVREMNTPLSVRIEQMLTEARVVLPGAQALLGFQFAVTLTRALRGVARAREGHACGRAQRRSARRDLVDDAGGYPPRCHGRSGHRRLSAHWLAAHYRGDAAARDRYRDRPLRRRQHCNRRSLGRRAGM